MTIRSTKCEVTGSFVVRDITGFDFDTLQHGGGYLGVQCEGGRLLVVLTDGNLCQLASLLASAASDPEGDE